MHRNSKSAILIVLVTAVIFVWVPKGKKTKDAPSATPLVAFDRATPATGSAPGKRTEFVDWGRDPFARPQGEETGVVPDLSLLCIIRNDEGALAFINESIVRVGDKIADKTVKRIEQNRVILTDGRKDYILKMQE